MAALQVLEVQDVVATVRGHTVKGRFLPATRELRVLTRPWAGQVFASPAEASAAVGAYFAARDVAALWRLADGGVLRASARRAAGAAQRGAALGGAGAALPSAGGLSPARRRA